MPLPNMLAIYHKLWGEPLSAKSFANQVLPAICFRDFWTHKMVVLYITDIVDPLQDVEACSVKSAELSKVGWVGHYPIFSSRDRPSYPQGKSFEKKLLWYINMCKNLPSIFVIVVTTVRCQSRRAGTSGLYSTHYALTPRSQSRGWTGCSQLYPGVFF